MPSGFLARSVLARKLLDTLYVLAIRIGPEMSREYLCVPALQRFFFIFNKAYGIADDQTLLETNKNDQKYISDESNLVEIRREGGTRDWCITGQPLQISQAQSGRDDELSFDTPTMITSMHHNRQSSPSLEGDVNSLKKKALEEIQDVFTPSLAHVSYVTFLKYLGESTMLHTVKNISLILTLCHEHEQPGLSSNKIDIRNMSESNENSLDLTCSNSFGTNIAVGNRIEVQNDPIKSDVGPIELLNLCTYKLDQVNTSRHLRGNWLAYWEHEIGRADKDNHFNIKQIKLQSYNGESE